MHKGILLKRIVKSSDIPVKMLMKRMHLSRTTYYNHIKNKDLPLETLYQYGRVLGYDFSRDLPEMKQRETMLNTRPLSLDEAIRQSDSWRSRYYQLLEEVQLYLESRILVKPRKPSK